MPLAELAWETLAVFKKTTGLELDHLLPYVIRDRLCEEGSGKGGDPKALPANKALPDDKASPDTKASLDNKALPDNEAHDLAVQLVSSLNLAQRLRHRTDEDGSHYQSHLLRRHYEDFLAREPSLAANTSVLDIFDILHPQYQRCTPDRETSLAHYCQRLLTSAPTIDDIKKNLDAESRKLGEQRLLDKTEDMLTIRILTGLARCGFTAWAILANSDKPRQGLVSETTIIPGALLLGPALQFNNTQDAKFAGFVQKMAL